MLSMADDLDALLALAESICYAGSTAGDVGDPHSYDADSLEKCNARRCG